ncbi:MAG: 23S rRNA (cytosine(1962)-C(5))-methyltransferase RlmI [Bacteroidales bacterium]|nr:23S rRNA (cytosine(1962)-C(5))-methyltransferase RlmI [Bacteroidales bacterium]
MKKIFLKPGREKSLIRRHPWIFTGSIDRIEGKPESGETVMLVSSSGQPLALGAYSPQSQIIVRIWSWDVEEVISPDFFKARIARAVALRKKPLLPDPTDAYRMVFSESDGLPGLIVDRFGSSLVCQFSSAGAEFWKQPIVEALMGIMNWDCIYERSDMSSRRHEGLEESTGLLAGIEPVKPVVITKSGRQLEVDLASGQKTGYYLDQRDNRTLAGGQADGLEVLDCYSYSGGFSIALLKGGAIHATLVDSSAQALEQANKNLLLNGLSADAFTLVEADVPKALRRFRDEGRSFGLIILDPPKFIESRNQIDKGARAYKDINMLAIKLLKPGGLLFTFSCSGHMEDSLFQKIVADAAVDAGRDLQILRWLSQGPDHPVLSSFPEGRYLKGLMGKAY